MASLNYFMSKIPQGQIFTESRVVPWILAWQNFRADRNPRDQLHLFLISAKLKCKKVTIWSMSHGQKQGSHRHLKQRMSSWGLGAYRIRRKTLKLETWVCSCSPLVFKSLNTPCPGHLRGNRSTGRVRNSCGKLTEHKEGKKPTVRGAAWIQVWKLVWDESQVALTFLGNFQFAILVLWNWQRGVA